MHTFFQVSSLYIWSVSTPNATLIRYICIFYPPCEKKELVDSTFLALDRKKIEYRYPYHEKNESICRLWNTSWLARTISLSQSKI